MNEVSAVPQSFRSLIYLWSAVFSISAVGAATLQAFGPVSPHDPGLNEAAAPAVASAQPVAAAAPRLAEAEELAEEPPVIDLAAPSPAVLAAGITEVRKLPPPKMPASVPSQPVVATAAPSQPVQAPRRAPAPARRPAPPMEAASAPPQPPQGYAFYAPTGYIGVYTRGPDGMRVFRSYP